LKFQAATEKTAKDARGLLYFAAPGSFVRQLALYNIDLQQGRSKQGIGKICVILPKLTYTYTSKTIRNRPIFTIDR